MLLSDCHCEERLHFCLACILCLSGLGKTNLNQTETFNRLPVAVLVSHCESIALCWSPWTDICTVKLTLACFLNRQFK